MNITTIVSVGLAGFAALILLPGSCSVIDPGHRGVSVTLGKVDPEAKGEGFILKKPWIEKIIEFPIQQQTVDGKTDCFSSDTQLVQVSYSVMYKIPESKVVELYQKYKGDPFDSLVKPRLEEQLKQITSAYKSEDLIKSREIVKGTLLTKLQKELAGIVDVQDVLIRNIDLSDLLETAIENKQVEEQKSLAKVYQLKAAEQEAQITIVKAKAEAESIKIAGDALKDNPAVLGLKIVEKWDGISPKYVGGTSGANILLPIEK